MTQPLSPNPRPARAIVWGLWANAILMAAVLLALVSRDGPSRLPFESAALAQQVPQPIAGGGGFYLMPAQFGRDRWGCYVMDVDAQTLIAYEYVGEPRGDAKRELRLVAARTFRWDRQLRNHNTTPPPKDIREIVELEQNQERDDQWPRDETPRPPVGDDAGRIDPTGRTTP